MQEPNNTAYNCLIAIMMLLLIAATLSLFIAPSGGSGTDQIDIIIRTALSSVFGFLISATIKKKEATIDETGNFKDYEDEKDISNSDIDKSEEIKKQNNNENSKEKNINVKVIAKSKTHNYEKEYNTYQKRQKQKDKLKMLNSQIMVIAFISFYCLFFIILARNVSHIFVNSSSTISTIAQFRDFISSGIGALIGLTQKK